MKEIEITWQHLDVEGETCERCAGTGEELDRLVTGLQKECGPRGVEISLTEIKLTKQDIAASNRIFINGTPLDELIAGATVSSNACGSCSDLLGRETCCPTIIHAGVEYETIPRKLIREAVCKIAQCC